MKKITDKNGRGIYVEGNDIDTDQIIPARFMKCVTFDGLGQYAFYDARFSEDESSKEHSFNKKQYEGAEILVVNENFGCGSSREHAPQALMRWGIKALIGESFAEIFAGNCISNGIPVVRAQKSDIENLITFIKESPAAELRIDLVNNTVDYGDFRIEIIQQVGHRKSLIDGVWDTLTEMLDHGDATIDLREHLPYKAS